ncbi:MAG TPA: DUF2304 domain-containing protein [Candidatus Andersenbacteria bacterium]|nr:MAG: hypothetical protein A2854_02090 [Parcubacteria group bacterium RIFCSPHIGHO2_01_FULL_56_18]HLD25634.1 DUF2304 domain-containing protein [Candidatus Andersenbacteria bacterium]
MLQPYQFIVAALSLVMIGFGVERYLRGGKGQTPLKLAVRLIVWGGMFAITIFPQLTYDLATLLGIEGNVNAVMMIAFLLVFLLIFKMLSVIERIEHQVTLLTRAEALEKFEQHDQRRKE